MLTVTDDRSSHIKNSKNKKKVILLNCCILTYDDVQRYSNITFLFLLFLMCELRSSVAVNMCINCSFFTLMPYICCRCNHTSKRSCRTSNTRCRRSYSCPLSNGGVIDVRSSNEVPFDVITSGSSHSR